MQLLTWIAFGATLFTVGIHTYASIKIKSAKRFLYITSALVTLAIAIFYFLTGTNLVTQSFSLAVLRTLGVALMVVLGGWGSYDISLESNSEKGKKDVN